MPDEGVLILGCGYSGAVLAQHLAFQGRPVYGTSRSDVQTSVIRSRGAEPVRMDTADLKPIDRLRGRVRRVVSCIPPGRTDDGGFDDAHARILERLARWDLERFVYVSSTSVYGDRGGAVVTETTPCEPDSPRGSARLEVERTVLDGPVPSCVVRPAGIYGPKRSQLHRVAAGRYRLVGDGGAFTNRIHVFDLAALLEAALDRGTPGAIYLATDQRPATQREVVDHIVAAFGLPQPPVLPLAEARVRLTPDVFAMITGSKRLDPSWTLETLGVALRYPDFVAGLADIWRREEPELTAAS